MRTEMFARSARAVLLAAVIVLAQLAGCADDDPITPPGPPPDPEADGCVPYGSYLDGDVPRRPVVSWISSARDVAAGEDLVAVACGARGLRLMDAAGDEPRIVGHVGAGYAEELAFDGHLLAVADNAYGVSLHDVSDPAAPRLLFSQRVVGTGQHGGTAGQTFHVALAGDDLFVSGNYHQVVRFDVSDPARPVERERLEIGGDGPALAVVDGYLYVGLDRVCDLGGRNMTEVAAPGVSGVHELERRGRQLHAVTSDKLVTVDVARPADPWEVDRRSLPGAYSLAVSGDRVFVGGSRLGVVVYDFIVPGAPVQVGQALAPYSVAGLALTGGLLFYAADGGVGTLDVRDPASPEPVSFWSSPGSPLDFAVAGSAVVVAFPGNLRVFTLEEGLASVPVAVVPDDGGEIRARGCTASGSLVFFARDDGGWQTLDVARPAAPVLFPVVAPQSAFVALAVDGDRLAAAAGDTLMVYDLDAGPQSVLLSTSTFDDAIQALSLAGDRLLLSLDDAQLVLLDLADPAAPVEVARDVFDPHRCDSRAVHWADGRGLDFHGGSCCALRPVTADEQGSFREGPVVVVGEYAADLAVAGDVAYALVRVLQGDPQTYEEDIVAVDLRTAGVVRVLGRATTARGGYRGIQTTGGHLYALEASGVVRFWLDCLSLEGP